MNEQLLQRIQSCPTLPSLPSIAVQVLKLAQSPQVDLAEIAAVISKDPALSGKILKTVNSSFYGRTQAVSTVSHALVILGIQSVKTLVLSFSLVTNLNKNKGFRHLDYWRRSIYSATAARLLAAKLQIVQQEEAFLAALLHDIGMLVLEVVLGDDAYGSICANAKSHEDLANVENKSLGANHAEVGGVLAKQWKLPPVLEVPIGWHERSAEVTDPTLRKLTQVVALAGRCASIFVEENPLGAIARVRKTCLESYRMPQGDCDAILGEIGQRTKEAASLFEINLGKATDLQTVLLKANEALVNMSLQSQQQAVSLTRQNADLKVRATTDGLTGLTNRACFDDAMAAAFAARAANGEAMPLSLIMLDLDHFKRVNDSHGHQAGDDVLRTIGRIVKAATRPGITAARFGGEEFALLMPKVNRAAAAAMAEMLRKVIGAKPLSAAGKQLPITASFGVATADGQTPFANAEQLVKAADLALYHAKASSRNCVKVFSAKAGPSQAAVARGAPGQATPPGQAAA
jgi:diguanylate cyclase (GGDEF)-like protein